MLLTEFELISKYFKDSFINHVEVKQGIGDDAAIVSLPPNMELAMSMDTLVAGVHFPVETRPEDIGYKSLAVNLSDMAAMGADPRWITLSLTMPENNENWLQSFMSGFGELANQFSLSLIGGDLTRGPLSITVQIHGFIPRGMALYRQRANTGDLIYVSGTLGDAGLALKYLAGQQTVTENFRDSILQRLNRPVPRIELGITLRGIASSAIDISDGLLADLGHLLCTSHNGAEIYLEKVPKSEALQQLTDDDAADIALTSGDDYELCFTIPESRKSSLEQKIKSLCTICCIGKVTEKKGIRWIQSDGSRFSPLTDAYRHF